MDDFSQITSGIDNTQNQQFRRERTGTLLGNRWLWAPAMLLSFRKEGSTRSGVPYLAPVASYLDRETQDLAQGIKTFQFPNKSQYIDPTQRQAQNLDRNPRAAVNISILLAIGVAVLAVAVLMVSVHLGAQVDIGK